MKRETRQYQSMRKPKKLLQTTMSEARLAWLSVYNFKITQYVGKADDFMEKLDMESDRGKRYSEAIPVDGGDIVLNISGPRSYLRIGLSNMTEVELQAFSEFIQATIDKARPVCRVRDQLSQEMLDEYDDDSNPRIFRSLPQLTVRKGPSGEYDQGILDRLEGVGALVRRTDSLRSPSLDGGAVAERDEADSGTEDDGA